jgi:iron complex transport system substrate-binding protein
VNVLLNKKELLKQIKIIRIIKTIKKNRGRCLFMKNMKNIRRAISAFMVLCIFMTITLTGCVVRTSKVEDDNNETIETVNSENKNQKDKDSAKTESKNVQENNQEVGKQNVQQNTEPNEKANNLDKPEFIKAETESQITITDPFDHEITIDKKPERVVVLVNSILDLWYMAGGTAVARVTGTENVPPEAEDLEEVGGTASPNVEKIVALKPDLVIMSSSRPEHRELKEIMEQSNISYLFVDYLLYEDFINYLDLFTRITGREDLFESSITEINNKVQDTANLVSEQQSPKVLIISATSKRVQCELPTGITGDMVRILGAENIAAEYSLAEGGTKIEFSLERIVEKDPDVILITTAGDVEKAKSRIKEDIESNQAWAGLRAVKEGNVHYLPKDLYLYKPNARYPEAIENLAKILYPEVFK